MKIYEKQGSASSMLKSFEKTKSIQASVMSATGLNGNGMAGPAGSRPSPPNPYYQHHHYGTAGAIMAPHHRAHHHHHSNGAHLIAAAYQNGSSDLVVTTSGENGSVMKREKSSSHLSSMPYDEYVFLFTLCNYSISFPTIV